MEISMFMLLCLSFVLVFILFVCSVFIDVVREIEVCIKLIIKKFLFELLCVFLLVFFIFCILINK